MKSRPILFSAPMVRAILDGRKTQTRRIAPITDLNITQHGEGMISWSVHFSKPLFGSLGSYSGGRFSEKEARRIIGGLFCPYGQTGDQLWVREAWQYYDWSEEGEPCIRFAANNATTWPEPGTDEWANRLVDIWETLSSDKNFSIDNRARDRRWRPSIHMPRWASRITLEIVSVRVERLQDISEADALSEGITCDNVIVSSYYANWHHEVTADRHFFGGCPDEGFESACEAYAALWESINGAGSWDANPWVWCVEFKRVEQ